MKTEKFAVRKNWPEKFLYTLRMGEASLTRGRSLTRSPTTPQVTYVGIRYQAINRSIPPPTLGWSDFWKIQSTPSQELPNNIKIHFISGIFV